jgi:hypothetical protein
MRDTFLSYAEVAFLGILTSAIAITFGRLLALDSFLMEVALMGVLIAAVLLFTSGLIYLVFLFLTAFVLIPSS